MWYSVPTSKKLELKSNDWRSVFLWLNKAMNSKRKLLMRDSCPFANKRNTLFERSFTRKYRF